jgi:hypothetical protein
MATYSATTTSTNYVDLLAAKPAVPPKTPITGSLGNKASANKAAAMFGLKAQFYTPADIALLQDIFGAYDLKDLKYNPDTLHSYHPAIDVKPLDKNSGFRPCDSYGFMRLGLAQNFLRPHLKNVISCHRFNAPAEVRAPFGNLSYLANPWWATYAFYKQEDSQTEFYYPTIGVKLDKLGLPNLIATVNVMLGYDSQGYP